jgi:5,10-methenyltetrahydrofolate synthetase
MTAFSAPEPDFAAKRKHLREHALKQRQAMPVERREALTGQLIEHLEGLVETLAPRVLGFCWPYRAEPDLRAWVQAWLGAESGRMAALPVVLERHAPMVFRRWTPGVPMPLDRHGIPHPPDGEALVPEVLLVPLNAFDDRGYRIGYGGGYFDRTLAGMQTTAVGVGFEIGRVPDTFPQQYDRPMQWVATEAGVMKPLS